jgi:hypothetical protein
MLRWCLPALDRNQCGRHWVGSLIVTVGIVIVALGIASPVVRNLEDARISDTAGVQFEAAVNWALCGRYGQITSAYPQNRQVINLSQVRDAAAYDRSVFDLLERRVGSRYLYCLQPTGNAIVEAGMMLIEGAALMAAPHATLKTLAKTLAFSRLVLLGLFALFLLRLGFSAVFTGMLVTVATYLTVLQGSSALFTAYPFILPVVLVGIVLAGFAIGAVSRWAQFWLFLSLGFWAGFLGNLRTSHYLMALAIIGLASAWNYISWKRTAIALLAAVIGLAFFDRTFVAPLRARGIDVNHTIAHSLVLGLSNPPNALSTREGIEWNDAIGVELARRVDPNAVFLGPTYESALFTYYARLWDGHPGEMRQIYFRKLWSTTDSIVDWLGRTGRDVYWDEKDGRFLALCAVLIRPLAAVLTLGGVFGLLLMLAFWLRSRWPSNASWLGMALGACGTLGFLEAAIILGSVNLWYNGVVIFVTLFAGLLPIELGLARFSRALQARWVQR